MPKPGSPDVKESSDSQELADYYAIHLWLNPHTGEAKMYVAGSAPIALGGFEWEDKGVIALQRLIPPATHGVPLSDLISDRAWGGRTPPEKE